MDPAVRKLIDQPWPDRKRYEEIGALLPGDDAELDRWFGEMIEALDVTGFSVLCIAALGAGRAVNGRHLERGAGLISVPTLIGSIAWHMSGNVVPHLLAAMGGELLLPVYRSTALFAVAAICEERLGGAYPPELITRARLLARQKKTLAEPGVAALVGIAAITRDEGLASILEIDSEKKWASAASLTETLKETCRTPPLDRVVVTAQRKRGGAVVVGKGSPGLPLRRAVARVGRNEPCPCQSGRKYKNCCMGRDAERLSDSSFVAGKSQAEVRAEPEPHLTADLIIHASPIALLRFDPRKIAPELLEYFFIALMVRALDDRFIECLDLLGWPEERDELCVTYLFHAMKGGRSAMIRKFLALHPRATQLNDKSVLGVQLALLEDEPARYLAEIQDQSLGAVRSDDPSHLEGIAYSLLASKLSAIGIFVSRLAIPLLRDESAQKLLEQVAMTRDQLGLSPDDVAGELLEKRLLEETRAEEDEDTKESRALAETRERLDAKAREVAFLRKTLETLRHDVKGREARAPAESARTAPAGTGPAVDESALKELRFKVQKLKGELKERHEERIVLREELREARAKMGGGDGEVPGHFGRVGAGETPSADVGETDADADRDAATEDAHLLPEESTEIQPARLPEFPRKFQETLRGLPRHVARNAVATIGRLASGELAAFVGVVRLKACPDVYRQRVGANHRLLFRLTPEHLVVVDLINRRDLDRRVKTLVAGGS